MGDLAFVGERDVCPFGAEPEWVFSLGKPFGASFITSRGVLLG